MGELGWVWRLPEHGQRAQRAHHAHRAPAVADEVDDHVALPRLAPLCRKLKHAHLSKEKGRAKGGG